MYHFYIFDIMTDAQHNCMSNTAYTHKLVKTGYWDFLWCIPSWDGFVSEKQVLYKIYPNVYSLVMQ